MFFKFYGAQAELEPKDDHELPSVSATDGKFTVKVIDLAVGVRVIVSTVDGEQEDVSWGASTPLSFGQRMELMEACLWFYCQRTLYMGVGGQEVDLLGFGPWYESLQFDQNGDSTYKQWQGGLIHYYLSKGHTAVEVCPEDLVKVAFLRGSDDADVYELLHDALPLAMTSETQAAFTLLEQFTVSAPEGLFSRKLSWADLWFDIDAQLDAATMTWKIIARADVVELVSKYTDLLPEEFPSTQKKEPDFTLTPS